MSSGIFVLSLRPVRGAKFAILFEAERSIDLSALNRTNQRGCPDHYSLTACGACCEQRGSGHMTLINEGKWHLYKNMKLYM